MRGVLSAYATLVFVLLVAGAALATLDGFTTLLQAKSAIHQILGYESFVIAAVAFTGSGIIAVVASSVPEKSQ